MVGVDVGDTAIVVMAGVVLYDALVCGTKAEEVCKIGIALNEALETWSSEADRQEDG